MSETDFRPRGAPDITGNPSSDLLYGVRAIATFLGMTPEQARPLIEGDIIPTFRLPGHTKRCARKSTLNARWAEIENNWRMKHAGAGAPTQAPSPA